MNDNDICEGTESRKQLMTTSALNIVMGPLGRAYASIKMVICKLTSLALTWSWRHVGEESGKPSGSWTRKKMLWMAKSQSTTTTSKRETSSLIWARSSAPYKWMLRMDLLSSRLSGMPKPTIKPQLRKYLMKDSKKVSSSVWGGLCQSLGRGSIGRSQGWCWPEWSTYRIAENFLITH